MDSVKRIYERSGRHSEPITAQNPGVKCPPMSYSDAQKILDSAERVGNTLQATYGGVGFVARNEDNQRGRDLARVSGSMGQDGPRVEKTLAQGLIKRRDIRDYKTRGKVRDAFGGRYVGG